MSDFSDLKAQIAEWANRQDWSDALVTTFVRMAESQAQPGAARRADDPDGRRA